MVLRERQLLTDLPHANLVRALSDVSDITVDQDGADLNGVCFEVESMEESIFDLVLIEPFNEDLCKYVFKRALSFASFIHEQKFALLNFTLENIRVNTGFDVKITHILSA